MDTKRQNLLGLILERENILTRSQVLGVLAEQKRLREGGRMVAFGEIALELALLSPAQLKNTLMLQSKLAVAPGQRKPLGFYLLEAGLVSPSQLLRALEEQKKSQERLGEILIRQGSLNETLLEMFLNLQRSEQEHEAKKEA